MVGLRGKVFVQDGVEFFSVLRFHVACLVMEQKLHQPVEEVVYWISCELLETLHGLQVNGHGRASEFEKLFWEVQGRWGMIEPTFYALFRIPSADWDTFNVHLRIVGRDLYLSEYRE